MLSSLLECLEFNLACHINALLACDRRRRFQLSDQPIHVLLEFARRSECIDANRAKEMTARILIGVERSHRAGEHTTKNLHENRETVSLVAAAFTRSTEGEQSPRLLGDSRVRRLLGLLVEGPAERNSLS